MRPPIPTPTSRTGSLTVGGQSHTVTQTGLSSCTVDLNKYQDSFAVAGGSGTFDVAAPSTCAWIATSTVGWMRVTDPAGGAGTGSRRVTYAVDANPGAGSRSGTIAVGGRTFTITQAGTAACDYSVAPVDVRTCMSEGFVRTVSVTTPRVPVDLFDRCVVDHDRVWAVGCRDGHHQLHPRVQLRRRAAGEHRGALADANGRPERARRRRRAASTTPARRSSTCRPRGGDYYFEVVSQSTDTKCGGALQNGCVWSAVSSASWVTVLSYMPRNGDNPVSFRVAANGTGAPRTATIVVRDRTVTVRQAGS